MISTMEAPALRGCPGGPVIYAKPLIICTISSSARRSSYGPDKNPFNCRYTRPGLIPISVSKPSPRRPMVSKAKFSNRTSEERTKVSTAGRLPGAFRSIARLRLLRQNRGKKLIPTPFRWRVRSPSGTGSILVTVAPKSANIIPADGPITAWLNSNTFMPASGKSPLLDICSSEIQKSGEEICRIAFLKYLFHFVHLNLRFLLG